MKGLRAVARLIEARGAVAQICVLRHGQVVLDHSFRGEPTSLFWIFSASKAFVAVLIHHLAQEGRLGLDEPIATYWPAFGSGGKQGVTIRHVLQHRSGLPCTKLSPRDAWTVTDWERATRCLAGTSTKRPPGGPPTYMPLAYGFILGEVIQRVTGKPYAEALGESILKPLRLADTYAGLPESEWPRRVRLECPLPGGFVVTSALNSRRIRSGVIPAAGISTTARDLADFYAALLTGGLGLSNETLQEAVTPTSDGELDRGARLHIRWSNGFELGGPRSGDQTPPPFGRLSSSLAFGHNGSNCCIGWADPERQLACAYLTNLLEPQKPAVLHLAEVADAVIEACS